jgi:hypothetical protein
LTGLGPSRKRSSSSVALLSTVQRHAKTSAFCEVPFSSAAIALGSVLVSGTQVWVSYISKEKEVRAAQIEKDKELALNERQSQRQYCLDGAKLSVEYLEKSGGSSDEIQRGLALIQTTCPEYFVTNSYTAPPHPISNSPAAEELLVEKITVDSQVIPLSGWKNFAARVVDRNRRPVEGAKLAWRTPDMGSYTYVGVTDRSGVSSATNLYTSSTTGTHQQTADVVGRDTPLGFTDGSKLKPTSKSVTFQFTFSGK